MGFGSAHTHNTSSLLCSGLEVGVTSEPGRFLSPSGLSQVRKDGQTSEQIQVLPVPQGERKMKGLLKSRLNEKNIPGTHSGAEAKALEWEEAGKVENYRGERGRKSRRLGGVWVLAPSPRHGIGASLKPQEQSAGATALKPGSPRVTWKCFAGRRPCVPPRC